MKKLIFILGLIAFGLYFTSCEKEEEFEPIEPTNVDSTVTTDTIIMYDTTSTKIAITQLFNMMYSHDSLDYVGNDTLCFYDTLEYLTYERWVLVSYDEGDYDTVQYDYYSYMPEPELKTYFPGVTYTNEPSDLIGIYLTKDTTYILDDIFIYNKELNTIETGEIPDVYYENNLEIMKGKFIFQLDDNFLIESGTCNYDSVGCVGCTSYIYGTDETNYRTVNGSIIEQHGTYKVNFYCSRGTYKSGVTMPFIINHIVTITKL